MPSTYTAQNRLELQNPGEGLNVWGSKLNADTIALTDFAAHGYTALTPSGNITLTTANGAADQARSAILDFTSGTGGTITIPSVSHVYRVRNACSGSVVFTTGSGTTATVETGNLAVVICDGTNCYRFADAADIAAAQAAAEAYALSLSYSGGGTGLPAQAGNAGNFLTTNGSVPAWSALTNAATATALATARNFSFTGSVTGGPTSFDGSANVSIALSIASGVITGTNIASATIAGSNIVAATITSGLLASGVAASNLGYTPLNAASNLSDLGSASTARTNLSLGTSATVNTGTSGGTIPLLNGTNTWAAAQTLSALATFSAGANMTPAATPATNAVGYLGLPQTTHSANYTGVMADAGKEQFFTSSATGTIPANSSVAYPIGTVLVWSANSSVTLTVAITTDTMTWVPAGTTGSRTVTGPGFLIARKITSTGWWVYGLGVS